eukprot:Nitzschia sp. Nitz4//scaffold4_size323378//100305//104932//NITZ4_000644-RA/size323378-snap-gene-0.448-mRNA-1//-1//CDS//3329553351//7297//frame0
MTYGSIETKLETPEEAKEVANETSTLLPSAPDELPNHETSSFLTQLVFGWMNHLLQLGNVKGKLDPEDLDLFPLPPSCETSHLSEEFERQWAEERVKANPSLIKALFRAFGFDFVVGGFILKLMHDSSLFVGPQVLNGLILFMKDADAPLSNGLWLTLAVTLSQLTMSFCLRHYFFKCYKFGLRIRTAVVVAVYKKALVLSSGERYSRSLGEITNLMSIDAQKLQDLTTYLHAVWYSFFQIGLALYFLWLQLGPSCLAGVVVIVVMVPVTKYVAKWMGSLQKRLMVAKDKRLEVNSEVLGAMKIIKLQAWEGPFIDRIVTLRDEELSRLRDYIVASCLSIMLWSAVPLTVALAVFAAYVLSGHDLEVSRALTALALFDLLRFPLFMLPGIVNRMVEAGVSLNRVKSFLMCEEYKRIEAGDLQESGVRLVNSSCAYEAKKAEDKNATPLEKELSEKSWELSLLKSQLEEAEAKIREMQQQKDGRLVVEKKQSEEGESPDGGLLCLKRIDLEVHTGELVAVVGGVGSGKSSILNAMLGEVRELSGRTEVKGKLAFFSQSPFVLNATLKANILFSHVNEPVDELRYQRALAACALEHDLKILPDGDQTEIGEKGITLSGGQKARVSLARAVYHNADVSLIDDALSAVDAHVAKHLFEECIVKELMGDNNRKRAVVLATNAIQHLNHPRVSKIVVVSDGRIVEQGTYSALSNDKSSLFSKYLAVLEETGVSAEHLEDEKDPTIPARTAISEVPSPTKEENTDTPKKHLSKPTSKLIRAESRLTGSVDLSVYFAWARAAGGVWVPVAIILAYGMAECMAVASKWWLTYWSEHGSMNSQILFLSIYALINVASMLAIFVRLLYLLLCGLRASRNMFKELLEVVLHVPMSFFDTTPVGRIINRFSKDMDTVDNQLMFAMRSYLSTILSVCSAVIVVSSVTPMFTVCLIPVFAFYAAQQRFFTMTYRELKRLDSINRSPLYALLGETVDGVATIRAYSAESSLILRLTRMLNLQQNAYYLLCVAQCWLAVRLELVGTVIISLACLLSVLEHPTMGGNETFAGLAGLSISFSLSITQSLNWSVRMASDLEAGMIAVERVREYCRLDREAASETKADDVLPADWPTQGCITFQGVQLRYRPGLPLVLKGLDFDIPQSAKVGVVGRTGAGKSTLMLALLRIVELDAGKIFIDGVDIKTLGLTKLRSRIAVIPQDPVLFSGTVRSNLDPFNSYDDERLLDVLARVGLYKSSPASTSATNLPALSQVYVQSLESPVREGGSNFSVGQRQLLVIARALLGGAGIVIMDEATASVDADTDARIQKVMRSEFKNATCITVAHRLNTIMDSDLILVMGNGRVEEFDAPKALLKKGGVFKELVRAAAGESA